MRRRTAAAWLTRLALGIVFSLNVSCAVAFVVRPEAYTQSFEVRGVGGAALIRGIGILFLMWNATYPYAIWSPWRQRSLLLIVIAQQAIGVAGETWMLLVLPPGHETLRASGWRFVAFDSAGLVALALTTAVLWLTEARFRRRETPQCAGSSARPGFRGAGPV
jgi:hypothetical protein